MREPKVSIIVPVYKVEKYIENCIRSIMIQDYRKIEIIAVEDGTPDKSGEILDVLSKEDDRIIVIHKSNGGVSTARNVGLARATGEYIMFVDGDDYVEQNYVSYFLSLIDNRYDMAISENCFDYKYKTQILKDEIKISDSKSIIERIYLGELNEAVWNKIYKRTFLEDNEIVFDPQFWYGEGMLFNIICLQYTDRIAVGKRRVYHQVYNPKSAMRKFDLESNYCGIRSLEFQKKNWKKITPEIQYAWDFHLRCYALSIVKGLIQTDAVDQYRSEYERCIKELKSNIFQPLKLNISYKRKLYLLLLAINPVKVIKYSINKEKRANDMCLTETNDDVVDNL